ncbi:MAG: glycosyltransferase family 4 protein [Candidatus Omnitrophica bacterium]|nr:glycosyltransferase family 4 protein [Candidatus Omnitrophota bacterium]
MKKKRLNISHLHWGFPPIIGGVETHLTFLLPTLVQQGHKVSLLTCAVEGYHGEDEFRGCKIYRTPLMDLNWLFKRGLNAIENEVTQVFRDFIEKEKPDILHAHNMHYFSLAHANILANLAKAKGLPLILTAHNTWDDILFLSLMRSVKWTHIIAVSHFIKQELIGIGISHKNITTVHHGIDHKMYHPRVDPTPMYKQYPQLKGRRVLFHPARMGLAKGCDVSVKALRILKEKFPDIMLVLAGTKNIIDWGATQNKDIAYIVELVDFFKMRDNVLIDAYTLEDMPRLYTASCVCIYPSSSQEPFGLTILEAMAARKPIVVTRAGGMPEIVQDNINGFVVPPRNFDDLANRVRQLFVDQELRERLGSTGRAMVEEHFTKEIMTEKTLAIYRKFL